jgi:hypothetical protein
MNRARVLLAAGLMCHAVLPAQTPPRATAFQQADSLAADRGGRGINIVPILRAETGKPFSATVTTQTTQTYLDGTHVSQTTTTVQYRDAEGRTRIERNEPGVSTSGPVKSITIRDPVARVSYNLDPGEKTAVKIVMAGTSMGQGSPPAAVGRGARGGRGDNASAVQAARNSPNPIVEDLGTTTVNGVPARGTRITTVVPLGAIGNDKEFRSVTERWFSPDLNLLIKSVSTDPRFGTTTYELTNISRQPPDPSLFQPPADYNIVTTQPAWPASPVIEAIEFRGISRVSPDTLKATVLSKVGDTYDEEALRRDFAALWKTNRFSDIQLKTERGARGGVIVRFVVTERP